MNQTPPVVSGAFPVVGHVPEFVRNRGRLFQRGFEERGHVFSLRLPKPVAVVAGSDLNRWFYGETDHALNISKPYTFLKEALGEVLFTASKALYEEQRPLLKVIFSNERMAGYIAAMNAEVEAWLATLGDEGEVEISAAMSRLTQYVAGRAFLGDAFRAQLGEEFWDCYADIGRSLDPVIPPHWPLPKFRRRDRAKARIREILAPLCEARRRDPDAYDDVIAILVNTPLPDGRLLSLDAVVSLWMGLLFAGHETTAGQAAWSIILPLQHPDVRERLEQELAAVDTRAPLGPKELRSLALTYRVIDETTRLRPSADIQMRVVEEPISVAGYQIPAGWRVMVTGDVSHKLAQQFDDPERFDPDRFSPERGEGKDAYAIVGFGGGRHKCTGMNFAKNEMAIILAKLLGRYELELVTKDPHVVSGLGANRPSPTTIRYRARR